MGISRASTEWSDYPGWRRNTTASPINFSTTYLFRICSWLLLFVNVSLIIFSWMCFVHMNRHRMTWRYLCHRAYTIYLRKNLIIVIVGPKKNGMNDCHAPTIEMAQRSCLYSNSRRLKFRLGRLEEVGCEDNNERQTYFLVCMHWMEQNVIS